jgi:predicted transcriptional regulator
MTMKMDSHSDSILSNNMRASLNEVLSVRYNLVHLSEDADINYYQLYRFMKGKRVSEQVINKIWYYINVLDK